MKKSLPVVASLILLAFTPCLIAADATTELKELVTKVQAKIEAGKSAESDYADDLKAFDALVAEHKGEKTDDVAQILVMQAMLYAEVIRDDEKAVEVYKKIKADFPETKPGLNADDTISELSRIAALQKIQKSLTPGTQFPDFTVKDLDGKPLSVANYKGNIVLIDFWATWCPPCLRELPNVLAIYEKYHAKGFSIIGVSLDQDKETVAGFIKSKNMTWPQYCDGQSWQSPLVTKYGISVIPSTFLLDREGKIIAADLRGDALEAAVAKATGAK